MKRWFLVCIALLLLVSSVSAATTTNFTAAAASDARLSWTSTPYDYLSVLRSLSGTAYDASTSPVTGVGIGSESTVNKYSSVVRFGWTDDTSAIPDDATITSAKFYIKGYDSTSTNGLGNLSVGLVGFAPSSATLDQTDYNKFIKNGDAYLLYNDTYLRYQSGWNRDGWNEYTLNAAALANISKTGYTSLGLMFKDDIENTTAELEFHLTSNSVIKMYQSTGGADDPFLQVTYDTPSASDSITVTDPDGGESWARATTHAVTWTYVGSPGANVNITLMKAGAEAGTIVGSTPIGSGGSGSYNWDIYSSGTTGNDYTIRIKSATNASINDTSNAPFTLTAASSGSSDNRTWSGEYDFYPENNILNVNISTLPVHANSAAWITNLTQLSSRWPLLYAKTGYSQPTSTETFWVIDPATATYEPLLLVDTDTYSMYDNKQGMVPIPDDMWINNQAGDAPATVLDFTNKIAYSMSGLSQYPNGSWEGHLAVWNWTDNHNRYTSSTTTSAHYENMWLGNRYTRSDNSTNRSETLNLWNGRSMVDLPQWAMMPTYDEVIADDVDHALYIIVPYAGHYSTVLWPAINTGSSAGRENCIAGGARVRLKASYDISGFSDQPRAILKGAKYWGGIVGDNSQPAYGIQIYLPNDTRWSTSQLNELYTVPLSAWEVVDESSLMVNRYTMDSVGSGPTSSFYMNGTATALTYGTGGTTYLGHTIGGNYAGATDYPTYSAGYDAVVGDGSTYLGTTVYNKAQLIDALSKASAGDVVYVAGTASIDMGTTFGTEIPAGVTLASNRGSGGSSGALIYSTAPGSDWEYSIFTTGGAGARITGIRMAGESYPMDYLLNETSGRVGVKVLHSGAVIDNCDLSGFGYASIISRDAPNVGKTVVNFSYIHENQNRNESYGLEVDGGYAEMYGNILYKNRHSITGAGDGGESYSFHHNRILDTGTWDVTGAVHVDAHGSAPSEAYSGERYDIYSNSFEGGHIAAIHQRGLPSDGMYVYYNDILTDGAYTGVLSNMPMYQTYQAIPGSGNMYVTYNRYKGTEYNGGLGVLSYQLGSSQIASTDAGVPFGGGDPGGAEPVTATFTDTSTGTPTAWIWNRTNALVSSTPQTFSTSQDPGVVTFYAGNWSIQLVASNAYGSSTTTANTSFINVTSSTTIPTANFTADNTTPSVGQSVTFTDLSTGSPTSWLYGFTPVGRTSGTFTTQNTTVSFTEAGNYTVSLRATNAAGSNTMTKTNYITVNTAIVPPVANFTPKGTYGSRSIGGISPLFEYYWNSTFADGSAITFTDTSTGSSGTAWNWSFQKADGTYIYSSLQNPTIVFNTTTFGTGERAIIFNVSNAAGFSRAVSPYTGLPNTYFTVSSPPVVPIPRYTAENTNTTTTITAESGSMETLPASAGHVIRFTDASYNEPTAVQWTFYYGGGSSDFVSGYSSPFNVTIPLSASEGQTFDVNFYAENTEGGVFLYKAALIVVADTTPPNSVSSITNSTGVDQIVWGWTQSTDTDHVMIWKDGVAQANETSNTTTFTGLLPETTYQLATKTVDAAGNVNGSFVNSSATTQPSSWNWSTPGCSNWVVPVGVTSVTMKITGAGSSGRGGQSALYPGDGGHAGQHATYVDMDVTPGNVEQICIGTGGANSSYNDVGHAGTESSALGITMAGGAAPDILYVGTSGGDGEMGVFSTVRFALNGTAQAPYAAGVSGLGFGAGGAGASHDDSAPFDTQGGYGANGYVEISAQGFFTGNTPDFVADTTESGPGTLVHFTDLSTIVDTAGLTYNWSFGDGGYSSVAGNTQHVFAYTGSYDISLTLTTSNGSITETKATYINIVNEPDFVNPPNPTVVNFHILTGWMEPLPDVNVSITPVSTSTGDWDWLAAWLALPTGEQALGNGTMYQTTDSFGLAQFLMTNTVKYNVSFTKTGYTIPSLLLVPTSSDYTQYATATGEGSIIFEHGMNELEAINITVSKVDVNETYSLINLSYADATGKTTGGYVDVYQRSQMPREAPTRLVRWQITSSNQTESLPISHNAEVSGSVQARIEHEDFGDVNRTYTFDIKGAPVNFMGFGAEIRLLVALGIMLLTVMLAGATTGRPILVVVSVEGWIFYATGFFQAMITRGVNDTAIASILVIITVVAFISNVPYRRK